MSRDATITQPFGDGEHPFRLAIGELRELQEACDAGPPLIARRLWSSEWRVDDVREVIRLGLVGGGMEPMKALALVKRYVEDRPAWAENALLAQAVLGAALFGAEDEEPGKSPAGAGSKKPKTRSRKRKSASRPSTETAPS